MQVGDLVKDPHSANYETVLAVHPQGEVDIYKCVFQDGAEVFTCGEHLWRIRKSGNRGSRIYNTIEVAELLEKEHSKGTYVKGVHSTRKHWPLVSVCKATEYTTDALKISDLEMHPYVLGVLIGDGGLTSGSTVITSADPEIPERIQSLGYEVSKYAQQYAYGIKGVKDVTELLDIRKKSNLKSIPEHYTKASIEARYELLRGLMDTDGTASPNGNTMFCSTSLKLAQQVQELVRSLGGTATLFEKPAPFYKDAEGNRVVCLKAYEVYIRYHDCSELFHLQRKKDRCRKKVVCNRFVSVDKVEKDFATCISISGESKEFITDNFVVTHNSYLGAMDVLKHSGDPKFRCLVVRRISPQIHGPGGIFETFVNLHREVYGDTLKVKKRDGILEYPAGGTVSFRHCQYEEDKHSFQG